MLVFGMKDVNYIVINDSIHVRMTREGGDVKLCIEAPRDVVIERDKVYEKRCSEQGTIPRLQFDKPVRKGRFHAAGPEAGIRSESLK
ncbi:MAG TPA: carbon storage regulator [Anaerovoracaceae bacterium]|nr:carbon storage regulator [Anaerovoracaceae bacterium]